MVEFKLVQKPTHMYNNETERIEPKDGRTADTDETPTMGTETTDDDSLLPEDEADDNSELLSDDDEDFIEDDENLDEDIEQERDETGSGE